MGNTRQTLHILVLGLLLLLIVGLPFQLTAWNNDRRLNEVHTAGFSEEPFEISKTAASQYTTQERLRIMAKTRVGSSGIVTDSKMMITEASGENEQVIQNLQRQMVQLAKVKALPTLTFSEEYSLTVSQRTFLDTENLGQTVTVWGVTAEYADFIVNAIMDAETSVLYQVGVQDKNIAYIKEAKEAAEKNYMLTVSPLEPTQFLRYLGIPDADMTLYGDPTSGYVRWNPELPEVVYSYEFSANQVLYWMDVKYTTVEYEKADKIIIK